jgi:hypothetical protein
MITVLDHRNVPGMTAHDGVRAVSLPDALSTAWPTDAHLMACAPIAVATEASDGTRGTAYVRPRMHPAAEGINAACTCYNTAGATPVMVALIGDVDDPIAHASKAPASEAWRADVEPRLTASGLAWYRTRGGCRVLARLAEPITIASPADAAQWEARYLAWCDQMRDAHGIEIDRACKDATRIFRLPNVVRDGRTERSAVYGEIPRVRLPEAIAAPAMKHAQLTPVSGEDANAKPSDEAIEIADLIHDRWLDGGRVETNAWLHLCGWLLTAGWTKGAIGALLALLDADEGDEEKRAEHVRILRNARPIDGPGGARAWLGDDFEGVDKIVNAAGDRYANAVVARIADAASAGIAMPATLILQSRTDARTALLWQGAECGYLPVATDVIRHRIAELRLPISLADGRKPASARTLIERHGSTYAHTIRDFSVAASTYDPEADTVVVGYQTPKIAAAYDRDVDAWLRAVGGDLYPRLEAWLASCTHTHIARVAAVAILLGPADVGKSMLAAALAGLWGQASCPRADALLARFNGDLERCPIVFDDEARISGSGRLSTKDFRELAQSTERTIERKGREVTLLRGGFRLMIAANGYSDVRMTDLSGPDVVQAVSDRTLVVRTSADAREPLDALRTEDYRVDLPRVTAHLAWLGATVEPERERFIGAGGCTATALLRDHVERHALVFASLMSWLDDPAVPVSGWRVLDSELCADAHAIAGSLLMDRVTLRDVRAALAPFAIRAVRPASDGIRPRLLVLDVERLRDAHEWDNETYAAWLSRQHALPDEPPSARHAPPIADRR